ncbi:MAG: type II toxin-antitoxin system Phd/YefM family antitoxin [Candidatus Andersenbacteria bacterium]
MNTKATISITEARKKIFDITDEVQVPGSYYILTDKGRPKAVVLSAAEFEVLLETLDVLDYFPDLEKDITQAEREIKKGDVYPLEEVLQEHGYVLADKLRKKHVSRRSDKNRKKGSKKS